MPRRREASRGLAGRWAASASGAALVHVFHPDLLPELLDHLGVIPVPFDLIVTNATGAIDRPGHDQDADVERS